MRAHEATLVGTDNMGNKYYERMENTQFGMHLVSPESQKLVYIEYNYPSAFCIWFKVWLKLRALAWIPWEL